MTANKLADELDKYKGIATRDAATMLRQQQAEIEELKRKYKDMHNLATQAMSKVHQLEKEAQEK